VTPAEAEEALRSSPLQIDSSERGGEERHVELGETAQDRLLVVAWTRRHGKLRVVTAFPASRKWRALYARLRKGASNA
jgi:uncharacterized DUF497 family protein